MNWYYISGDKQEGPVEQQALIPLISSGHATGCTPVWRDGMEDWLPLDQTELATYLPESTPPPFRGGPTPPPLPSVSGGSDLRRDAGAQSPGSPPKGIFCAKCGQALSEGSRFCSKCGTPTIPAPAQAQPSAGNTQINNTGMRDSRPPAGSPSDIEWCIVPIKKYAVFTGRARRKEFWMFMLLNSVASIFLMFLPPLDILFSLAVFLPLIGVWIRRMHDTNRSGWCLLIPFANIIFACEQGTRGSNQYGPDPLQLQGGMP